MRNLIHYFIKYPIAINIIILAIVVFGVFGYLNLKSSFFPLADSDSISINISYPGASPQEIEEGVVLKIENNLKGIVGIDRTISTSLENSANIQVEMVKGYDINALLADVKNAADKVPNFPVGMEPVVISKIERLEETVIFVLTGEELSLRSLKYIARGVEDDLRNMEGISQVVVSGYPDEEIEIAVREKDLQAYDLSFDEVAKAVSQSNIFTSGGSVKTNTEEYLIRANNRSYHADEMDHLVIKSDLQGKIVRLKDVASVRDRWNESPNKSYFNGKLSVTLEVSNTHSEDLLSSAGKINEYISTFNASHDHVKIDIIRDSSIPLYQRTQLLFKNGCQGILLVLFFLALFLRPRLAFWVAAGLPISFFGMFMVAGAFDSITINTFSLFGMIIVIGILVDDGIVISENIYHHFEKGKSPVRAAIDGSMEVMTPILSSLLTTILAFSVFFFIDGFIGIFFGEIAIVVTLTLLVSLIEALLILPSHMAHSKVLKKGNKVYQINRYAEQSLNFIKNRFYVPALKFVMKYKFVGIAIPLSFLLLTAGALQGGIIKGAFFPSIASDRVVIDLTTQQGTNEQITDSIVSEIEKRVWEVEKEFSQKYGKKDESVVTGLIKKIGPGTSKASLKIYLLPGELRSFGAREFANAVREKSGIIHGVESLNFGSGNNFGGYPVSISLVSNTIPELKKATDDLKEELSKNPDLKDITDSDPEGIKEIKIQLKENAYSLGLTLNEVMSQVRSGFFGKQVQRFQRGRDEIKVWVRYDQRERSSIKYLDEMRIKTSSGSKIPFAEIATYEIERGEISIKHLDGQREIEVFSDVKDANVDVTGTLATIKADILPQLELKYPSVSFGFEGQNRMAVKVMDSAKVVVPIALVLIYIVIVFTFRSYGQPLMLLLLVPFSLIGVAWGHWIHGTSLNILSFLGIIALVGIMVNDGLVLITKFNQFLKDGFSFDEALIEAGKSRFRAILLTSVTTSIGLAPLIFETSRQAQFLIPMAIAIAYGIIIATFLTLFTLPVLIALSNGAKVYLVWLWEGKKPEKESLERVIREQKFNRGEDLES